MMSAKIRNFALVSDLSLEELVPKDNFYRRLEATIRGGCLTRRVRVGGATVTKERVQGALQTPEVIKIL